MKNKKLTYFLIAVVVAIWGLVIYRVFLSANSDNDDLAPIALTQVKEAYNDYTVAKDTAKLLLNYHDPFGLVKPKDTVTATRTSPKVPTIVKPAAPGINWSFISYSGYIRNPASKKLVTLLSINGQSYALREGEVRDQVKLLKNRMDSIEISYQGKTKFIVKR